MSQPTPSTSPARSSSVTPMQVLILLVFGALLGGLLSLAAWWVLSSQFPSLLGQAQLGEAEAFTSIADFQRTMLERDERDLQADQSVSLRSLIIPHSNRAIIYDLLPEKEAKFQGVPVRINHCGMRGEARSMERSASTFRIALLGDSFAFGWGVEESDIFASVLQRQLQAWFGDERQVEVWNLGIPGYSTFQQVALFEDRQLAHTVDAALVFFVENDFGLPFFIATGAGSELTNAVSFERQRRQDPALQEERDFLTSILNPNSALKRLGRLGKEHGFHTFVAINPRPKWKEDYKRLWILKRRHLLHHLPLRPEFMRLYEERSLTPPELSLPDDPHPSAAKHELLGLVLAAQMLPFITEEVG